MRDGRERYIASRYRRATTRTGTFFGRSRQCAHVTARKLNIKRRLSARVARAENTRGNHQGRSTLRRTDASPLMQPRWRTV